MKQTNFFQIKAALRSAIAVMSIMAAASIWAQDTTIDDAAGKLISRKMNRAAEALASMDGAKVESINDDSGLPAILVTFDAGIVSATGNNEPTEAAKTQLSKLATVLVENNTISIEVLGHSDNSKWRNSTAQQSVQKNLELSEKRARSVVNYLKSCGVADAQFKLVEGKGESMPVSDNSTTEGRAANRRVEVFLLVGSRMITDAIAESRPVRNEPETVAESRQSNSETAQSSSRKPQEVSAEQGLKRGDLMVFARSTGFDLGITSMNGYSTTGIDINAGAGYFILNKLAVTAEVQIGVSKATNMDAATSFGLGLGARYYFMKGLYAGAGMAGMIVKDVDDIQGSFGVEAGYDFFLNDHVFVEPALQFSKGINFSEFEVADGITVGLSLGIGVKF
jgi:outer membrane protein OmpA-like peptidoglycan-associated protein